MSAFKRCHGSVYLPLLVIQETKAARRSRVSPSSSLRSGGNSTDSASEARDVRLEEAPEAKLAGLLPGSLLIQWSHRDELVEPAAEERHKSSRRPKGTHPAEEWEETDQPRSCLPTTRAQPSSSGRKGCRPSADTRPHRPPATPHCRQSSTTGRRWSSYSRLQKTRGHNV